MNSFLKRRLSFLLLVFPVTFSLIFTGCGKDAALENYKANMNQFFENVKAFDSSINSINPDSETATTDLLTILDQMDASFSQMASLEVPGSFPGVDQLADEASEYMTTAVSYYHQAYEGETYDCNMEDVAHQNYERANLRLQYIVSILHGDIPEEIYTNEDGTSDEVLPEMDDTPIDESIPDTDEAPIDEPAVDTDIAPESVE